MLDYSKIASDLRKRMDTDDPNVLRHVVLDARLVVEEVAFERLRIANKKFVAEDIGKWKPRDVMEFLISEVDENAAREFTLSVGKSPTDTDNLPETAKGDEALEYEVLGTQAGINVRLLSKIWHALSSFLHASFSGYGVIDQDKAKKSVRRTIEFLEDVSKGDLLVGGGIDSVSFNCSCGCSFSKSRSLIKKNRIFLCPYKGCMERYLVMDEAENGTLERRFTSFSCSCGERIEVPLRFIDNLRGAEQVNFKFECGKDGFIKHGVSTIWIRSE